MTLLCRNTTSNRSDHAPATCAEPVLGRVADGRLRRPQLIGKALDGRRVIEKEGFSMAEIHEGGCVCRAIRYRVNGTPLRVSACYCTFCQRRTGGALSIHAFFDEQNIESAGDGLTTYEQRSDESNLWLRLHFCNRCATTVMLSLEKFPGVRIVTGGTFDDPNWIKIDRHVWTRSAQHWMVFPQNVDRFEKNSQGARTTR
jgi:hypothetical protein